MLNGNELQNACIVETTNLDVIPSGLFILHYCNCTVTASVRFIHKFSFTCVKRKNRTEDKLFIIKCIKRVGIE